MDDIYTIKIHNWDKHQTTKELKSMPYLRVRSDLFTDEKFYQLNLASKLLWLLLLTLAARNRQASYDVSTKYLRSFSKLRTKQIHESIATLEQLQLLTIIKLPKKCLREEKSIVEKSIILKKNTTCSKKGPAKTISLPIENLEHLSAVVSEAKLKEWANIYKDQEWLKNELVHAIEWSQVKKPKRTALGWTLFFKGWLKRAKPPEAQKKTFAQIEQENGNAAMRRVAERMEKKYGK